MKQILTTVMCIATIVAMTACGGKTNKKAADGSTETKTETRTETKAADYTSQAVGTELSAGDWQKAIKANYDFDLTLPNGWSFKDGKKENINPAYRLDFTPSGSDFKAAVNEIHQYLFDLTAKIMPADGNFQMASYTDKTKGERIASLKKNEFLGELSPDTWHFNTPKGAVQIALAYSEPNKFVRITLVFLGEVK